MAAATLVRPHIANMQGYVPGEQPRGNMVVKLNTNENPYPPSPGVRDAIAAACTDLELYPDSSARVLRERVGELYDVDGEGVVVGNGSDELLSLLIRSIVAAGQGVAYPVPTYSLYDTLVALQDARSVRVPFGADYRLPADLVEADVPLLLLANPNAPSGTAVGVDALEELVGRRRDRVVVIDEAYADFADGHALCLVGCFANVVVLRTLSKAYSLAGLRVGLALTSVELARELHKVRDSYNVNRLAQAGAIAALADQTLMRGHVNRVRRTRTRLTKALEGLGFVVLPSQANFVFARRPGEALAPLIGEMREKGILVRYFADLPDSLRISVGTDAQIDQFLDVLVGLLSTR